MCQAEPFRVTTNLDADLPQTQADPFQLEQIFVNLINNAREAMKGEQGPRELVISTALAHSKNGGSPRILIRFADNGPGIPPEVMPHVFDPFFTTKKPGEGMGLGLSLCDRIIKAHQGRIWVENASGGGAIFVLELPVLEPELPAEPDPARPSATLKADHSMPATESCRVLVVDDEPAVTRMVKEILSKVGFQVDTAGTGYQALSALEKEQFDLIISDLKMPEMDGQSFYKLVIGRHPHLAHRIVFSSGDSSGRRARAFLQEVGCAWISKPFQVEELLRLVHKALQDSRTSSPKPEMAVQP
jgi:two-component system NtrC family sensor kinase